MSNGSYSLAELAGVTGLEERTIRSYIERGLLAGANARGRAASYSDEHLARLNIISRFDVRGRTLASARFGSFFRTSAQNRSNVSLTVRSLPPVASPTRSFRQRVPNRAPQV